MKKRPLLYYLITVFFVLFSSYLFADHANAKTIKVPEDHSLIQKAINASSNGDIIIVRDGTYYENLDFIGKAITLKSMKSAENTIIDGKKKGSVVTFRSGEGRDSVIDGFTLTNGSGNDYRLSGADIAYAYGGGVSCFKASPTITNCVVSNNSAVMGGGIGCKKSDALIKNCIIRDNYTQGYGGGIGALYGAPAIINCSIVNNTARFIGGGVYTSTTSPVIIIESCNISNNKVINKESKFVYGSGGGIFSVHSYVNILNCTISENEAEKKGGGINASGSIVEIINCTISDNSSPDCELSYSSSSSFYRRSYPSSLVIINSIIWHSEDKEKKKSIAWYYYDKKDSKEKTYSKEVAHSGKKPHSEEDPLFEEETSYSIEDDSIDLQGLMETTDKVEMSVTFSDIKGGWEGEGNIDTDPKFIGFDNYHLKPDSPCIDIGSFDDAPAEDIDYEPRPLGKGIDIGSDEVPEKLDENKGSS
ncbi:right-handed parallel beta-helix repeat-containing protein [Thermodesulfobacteriota bacterium]